MSVKPVTSAAIVSPAPSKPKASTETKVSKFVQDDKLPSSRSPTRNISTYHLSTIEETDETGEISEPIKRTSAPVNLAPPATKPPKEDFRKMALLNKLMPSANLK